MSDMILISKVGLYETIRCAICKNPNQTERGCDGSCQYDKEMLSKVIDAIEGLAVERPHGEWIGDTDFDGTCKCSICRMTFDIDRLKMVMCDGKYEMPPCCPSCGSDNRPKEEKICPVYSDDEVKQPCVNCLECEIVENGKCAVCGKPLEEDRLFICRECQKKEGDRNE